MTQNYYFCKCWKKSLIFLRDFDSGYSHRIWPFFQIKIEIQHFSRLGSRPERHPDMHPHPWLSGSHVRCANILKKENIVSNPPLKGWNTLNISILRFIKYVWSKSLFILLWLCIFVDFLFKFLHENLQCEVYLGFWQKLASRKIMCSFMVSYGRQGVYMECC